jgi:small subunit ribosomal protein YMR-31
MHPSFRVARKPLISFIGKRRWPHGLQAQRPHPAAPTQLKEAFSDFLEKYKNFSFSSTGSSNGKRQMFNEFWEAPEYVWQPKVRKLEDSEIDAVLSGGASLR